MSNTLNLMLDHVDAILGPHGLAQAQKPNFRYSDRQVHYATLAAKGFIHPDDSDDSAQQTSLNALQASTGTGKTLGYLVPLMLYAAHTGERVAVSTYTRFLQRQILLEDSVWAAKWVKEVTGKSLGVARRVGANGYLSVTACARMYDAFERENTNGVHNTTLAMLESLQDWAESALELNNTASASGLLDDFMTEHGIETLPGGLRPEQLCLTSSSDQSDKARYLHDVILSKNADVLIVNHALLAINAHRWGSVLDGDREIKVLVCDEADRLTDAASTVVSVDVAVHGLNHELHEVGKFLQRDDLIVASDDFCHELTSARPMGRNMMSLAGEVMVSRQIDRLLKVVGPVAEKMSRKGKQGAQQLIAHSGIDQAQQVCDRIINAVVDLKAIQGAIADKTQGVPLLSWSPVRSYPSLRLSSPNPARILGRLWGMRNWDDDPLAPPRTYLKAALFTSATLGAPGRLLPQAFNSFFDEIGVFRFPVKGELRPIHYARTELFAQMEPSQFGKLSFTLADPNVANPIFQNTQAGLVQFESDPAWLDYTAMMIRKAHERGGKILVLATSFADANELATRLHDLPALLVHQRNTSINTWVSQYKATAGAVLITPSGWEGVDLPGEVQHLVICKIPFSTPDRVELEVMKLDLIRRGQTESAAENIITGRSVLQVKRKLAQGIGRAIRAWSDSATVWIADPRFPLPESTLNSLNPLLLNAPNRKVHTGMRDCIPLRFLPAYNASELLLQSGDIVTINALL